VLDFVNSVSAQYDQTESLAEQQVNLLQERRTALISAAVTGKIDVREFAPEAQEV
jgi:type I restriction enzyme S subunit